MFFNFHHHNLNKFGIYNLPRENYSYQNYFSIGIHPMDITSDYKKTLSNIKIIAQNEKCVSIGECGLDALAPVDEQLQTEVFKLHIELAKTLRKPLIIHCVKRHNEIARLCKNLDIPVIFHGFNKNKNIANMLLEKGFYLSFGIALFKNLSLQNVFIETPLERIFLETDASPDEIEQVYIKAAKLKQISVQELKNRIEDNILNILKLNL
ncbi:TatD family hydrolase [Riemerella anatipestifer]|uniref:Putative deoxyribonuclease YcfH n=1 Tax=Riemerella anatipestifer TaxID=34085 RepID=A0A1S7DSS6_RIEAN|nr:TatD family hydrolase [Riemerella anatipestifer]AQY22164.1 putative deoxyribonuclease YcfH [Riemerella anatipestifer]